MIKATINFNFGNGRAIVSFLKSEKQCKISSKGVISMRIVETTKQQTYYLIERLIFSQSLGIQRIEEKYDKNFNFVDVHLLEGVMDIEEVKKYLNKINEEVNA